MPSYVLRRKYQVNEKMYINDYLQFILAYYSQHGHQRFSSVSLKFIYLMCTAFILSILRGHFAGKKGIGTRQVGQFISTSACGYLFSVPQSKRRKGITAGKTSQTTTFISPISKGRDVSPNQLYWKSQSFRKERGGGG